jgi:hypothetical protein
MTAKGFLLRQPIEAYSSYPLAALHSVILDREDSAWVWLHT